MYLLVLFRFLLIPCSATPYLYAICRILQYFVWQGVLLGLGTPYMTRWEFALMFSRHTSRYSVPLRNIHDIHFNKYRLLFRCSDTQAITYSKRSAVLLR
ncbi:hypothetical protein V8C37DRAFT_378766 [Trichoderma ceciliae]